MPVSAASPAGSCLKTSWPGSITVRQMPGECQVQPGNGAWGQGTPSCWLPRGGPPSPPAPFLSLFSHCIQQILEAVLHCHQMGVVHRDLKVSDPPEGAAHREPAPPSPALPSTCRARGTIRTLLASLDWAGWGISPPLLR